jgi:hypothetical protein
MGWAAWSVLILTMLGFWTAVVWIVLSIIRGSTVRGSPPDAREGRSGARVSGPSWEPRRPGRRAEHQSRHFHRNDRQEKVLLTDRQEERR